MIGAYVSEDFYFFFNHLDIDGLRNDWGFFKGKLAYEKLGTFFKMDMFVRVDYEKKQYISTIDVDLTENSCTVVFTVQDFIDWFVNPSREVLKNGPNWRHGDSNVYIKTEQTKGSEDFRSMLIDYMEKVPEKIDVKKLN